MVCFYPLQTSTNHNQMLILQFEEKEKKPEQFYGPIKVNKSDVQSLNPKIRVLLSIKITISKFKKSFQVLQALEEIKYILQLYCRTMLQMLYHQGSILRNKFLADCPPLGVRLRIQLEAYIQVVQPYVSMSSLGHVSFIPYFIWFCYIFCHLISVLMKQIV